MLASASRLGRRRFDESVALIVAIKVVHTAWFGVVSTSNPVCFPGRPAQPAWTLDRPGPCERGRRRLDTIAKHRLNGIQAAAFDTRVRGPRFFTGAASAGIASD